MVNEPIEGELVVDEIEVAGGTALMAINKSEIDIQIATAKRYPRSITEFRRATEEMACIDEQTAGTMFYMLNRDGKNIEGPSIRMAEIAATAFKNLRYGARVVEIGDTMLVAQGFCMDLESNNATTIEVRRRITKRDGKRYSDDMIGVTANAACAIALRNAVFKIIPMSLLRPIYQKAKNLVAGVGGTRSIAQRRKEWLDFAAKDWKVKPPQILEYLGRKGTDDITLEDMLALKGLENAIRDGETTVEEAFGGVSAAGSRASKSAVNDKVNGDAKPSGAKPEPQGDLLGEPAAASTGPEPWDKK